MLIYRQKQTKQPSRAYLGVTDPRSVTSKFYIYTASKVVLFSRLGLVTVFLHPSVAASCQGRQILESCVLLPAPRGHRTNQEPKLTQPSDREGNKKKDSCNTLPDLCSSQGHRLSVSEGGICRSRYTVVKLQ